jgi:two-component system, response regulator, stage 0 sporulation protein F
MLTPIHVRPEPSAGLVLIAEDDDDLRIAMVMAMEADGYAVVAARDGAEALEYLESSIADPDRFVRPDVLICDVRMPRCDGIAMLRRLEGRSRIPVVVITAFSDPQIEHDVYDLGAAWIFDKPFDLDDLRTAVANVV